VLCCTKDIVDLLSDPACSLVGFWVDKPGWCWFAVRGKHCIMADKSWLKPTSEQADQWKLAGTSHVAAGGHNWNTHLAHKNTMRRYWLNLIQWSL